MIPASLDHVDKARHVQTYTCTRPGHARMANIIYARGPALNYQDENYNHWKTMAAVNITRGFTLVDVWRKATDKHFTGVRL